MGKIYKIKLLIFIHNIIYIFKVLSLAFSKLKLMLKILTSISPPLRNPHICAVPQLLPPTAERLENYLHKRLPFNNFSFSNCPMWTWYTQVLSVFTELVCASYVLSKNARGPLLSHFSWPLLPLMVAESVATLRGRQWGQTIAVSTAGWHSLRQLPVLITGHQQCLSGCCFLLSPSDSAVVCQCFCSKQGKILPLTAWGYAAPESNHVPLLHRVLVYECLFSFCFYTISLSAWLVVWGVVGHWVRRQRESQLSVIFLQMVSLVRLWFLGRFLWPHSPVSQADQDRFKFQWWPQVRLKLLVTLILLSMHCFQN